MGKSCQMMNRVLQRMLGHNQSPFGGPSALIYKDLGMAENAHTQQNGTLPGLSQPFCI